MKARSLTLAAGAVALWALAHAHAAADSFRVESARTRLDGQTYVLDAQIHYGFSELALEALDNGVPLTIEVHVQAQAQGGLDLVRQSGGSAAALQHPLQAPI